MYKEKARQHRSLKLECLWAAASLLRMTEGEEKMKKDFVYIDMDGLLCWWMECWIVLPYMYIDMMILYMRILYNIVITSAYFMFCLFVPYRIKIEKKVLCA